MYENRLSGTVTAVSCGLSRSSVLFWLPRSQGRGRRQRISEETCAASIQEERQKLVYELIVVVAASFSDEVDEALRRKEFRCLLVAQCGART